MTLSVESDHFIRFVGVNRTHFALAFRRRNFYASMGRFGLGAGIGAFVLHVIEKVCGPLDQLIEYNVLDPALLEVVSLIQGTIES